jgi:hypothetical protein
MKQYFFSIIIYTMKRHASKKYDIQSLLKSRNALYVVLFLSVANLFSYLMLKQLDAVAFFIIIGFLTTYFSKNMIIVMLTSVISTFLLVQIKLLGGNVHEGLTGKEESDKTGESDKAAGAGTSTSTSTAGTGTSAAGTGTSAAGTSAGKASTAASKAAAGASTSSQVITKEDRADLTALKAPLVNAPDKEKFSQQLNPARYNASDDDDEPRHKPKVDYAATLESAYDNLDKLLSSDAIRNMANDTGRLAEKQQMLMGNIEKMTPIMEKAGNLLNGFDMGSITKLMGNLKGVAGFDETMAKSFAEEEAKNKNEGFRSYR